MIGDGIAAAAAQLASSRMSPFNEALRHDVSNIAQDLMTRGLYHSSIQVTSTKAAGERSLVARAESIANTIKEVCESHNVPSSAGLATDLAALFERIYEPEVRHVSDEVEWNVPDRNKRFVPVGPLEPDVDRYRDELALFSATVKHRKTGKSFVRELFGITVVFLLVLCAMALAAQTLNLSMLVIASVIALLAFIVIVAVVLRRSDDISEDGFAKIVLAAIERIPRIPTSGRQKDLPADTSTDVH